MPVANPWPQSTHTPRNNSLPECTSQLVKQCENEGETLQGYSIAPTTGRKGLASVVSYVGRS